MYVLEQKASTTIHHHPTLLLSELTLSDRFKWNHLFPKSNNSSAEEQELCWGQTVMSCQHGVWSLVRRHSTVIRSQPYIESPGFVSPSVYLDQIYLSLEVCVKITKRTFVFCFPSVHFVRVRWLQPLHVENPKGSRSRWVIQSVCIGLVFMWMCAYVQ